MAGRKKKGADLTKVIIVVLLLAGLYLGYQQMSGDEGLVAEARHRRKKAAVKKPVNSNFWWPPSLTSLGQKVKNVYSTCPLTLKNQYLGSFVFSNERYVSLHQLSVYVNTRNKTNIIENPKLYINGKKSVMYGRSGLTSVDGRQVLAFETKNLFPARMGGKRVVLSIYGDVNLRKKLGQETISLSIDNKSMTEISYKWTPQMENALGRTLSMADFNKYLRSLPIKTQRTPKKNYRCIKEFFSEKG